MKEDKSARSNRKEKKDGGDLQWVIRIFCFSAALSGVCSLLSAQVLADSGYILAVLVLLFFILLGIVFDIIGVAVTAADPRPFHSMAAHKEKGAAQALKLLRSAGKVSNFCNDVVGDICGIISGATAAVIVSRLEADLNFTNVLLSIFSTALISGLTIGGKALGKGFALERCTDVVFMVGRIMHSLHIK